eukprot:CAMPEP_0195306960 /NCGR_PEP_ID=MMETSP0707-20130614/37469_1 /TAXON_ID=33640 /ORGANISM="Asterionellopsis glacialis, Strain CCMP134" /LENGTH=403 /DNA_ID=CAMNT_0040371193 /DNA_START=139 /DNA_END=1350 /DNA_ORIENTATION=-
MSWISFSAPSVDAEALDKELDSMPQEQKEEAHRDMYGLDEPIFESEAFLKHKLQLLDQVLVDANREETALIQSSLQDLERALSKVTKEEAERLLIESTFAYTQCDLLVEMFQRASFLEIVDADTEDYYKRILDARTTLDKMAMMLFDGVKGAFQQAQVLCPGYVNSDRFRLMFLRAERFDENAAARRLMLYWQEKVQIFGPEKAFREITLNDFEPEDQRAVNCGGIMLLPQRDNAGRAIIFSIRSKWDTRSDHRKSMLKWIWYVYHTAAEDEGIQRNGVVAVATTTPFNNTSAETASETDAVNSVLSSSFDRKLEKKIGVMVLKALPVRMVAFHHIRRRKYISSIIFPFILFLIGPKMRARFRQHDGNDVDECLAAFESYGMPPEILPTEIGGTLQLDYRPLL